MHADALKFLISSLYLCVYVRFVVVALYIKLSALHKQFCRGVCYVKAAVHMRLSVLILFYYVYYKKTELFIRVMRWVRVCV
jgi:hypothetical protein